MYRGEDLGLLVTEYGDMRGLTENGLRHRMQRAPHLEVVVIWAVSHCQGLAAVNTEGAGFDDPRTALLYDVVRVKGEVTNLAPQLQVVLAVENVATMGRTNPEYTDSSTRLLGVDPYILDTAD